MKTIKIEVYEFDELSEEAKEKARDWYRYGALDYEWWDYIYDDAENVGIKITEFDLDRQRSAEGSFTDDGIYCANKILEEHGEDCESHNTAQGFLKERDTFIDLAPRDEDGEFKEPYALDANLDHVEAEFLKSILEDYSILLRKEYEYVLSDESVDENIRANEYTFTKEGKRFG